MRMALHTLQHRSEFLTIAAGDWRYVTPHFVLQAQRINLVKCAAQATAGQVHVGYTASRKVGGAVARNRAKRRLREAARRILVPLARADLCYVVVARRFCVQSDYDALCRDLEKAVNHLNRKVPS